MPAWKRFVPPVGALALAAVLVVRLVLAAVDEPNELVVDDAALRQTQVRLRELAAGLAELETPRGVTRDGYSVTGCGRDSDDVSQPSLLAYWSVKGLQPPEAAQAVVSGLTDIGWSRKSATPSGAVELEMRRGTWSSRAFVGTDLERRLVYFDASVSGASPCSAKAR